MKMFRRIIKAIGHFIDKKIVVPVTKLVVKLTGGVDKSGKHIETWLSKTNTLLFISLILSIIIFVIIDQKIIIYNESSAEVLKSQPVTSIYNEEAYVVEGLPETVDITLIGSKTDLYIAKQSVSNEVRVDLTGLKPGQHKINLKYNQGNSSIDYMVNPSAATVIIYPKISENKILTLDLLNQESLDSKLTIDSATVENDRVIVKGADYQIKQVAIVKALVDISELSLQEEETVTLENVPLKAYNSNGDIVDVEIVPNKINVNLVVSSPSKEVPIVVVPNGEVAFGRAIASIEQSDKNVVIYGDKEALEKITSITANIDVSNLKDAHQYKVELEKPVGVRSMNINNINVKVQVSQSTDIDIPNVRINAINLNPAYNVQAKSQNDFVVTVNAKGVSSVIEKITSEDINAYIDLAGYTPGEYEVEVLVEGSDSKISYVSKTKKVNIVISEN